MEPKVEDYLSLRGSKVLSGHIQEFWAQFGYRPELVARVDGVRSNLINGLPHPKPSPDQLVAIGRLANKRLREWTAYRREMRSAVAQD